MLIARMESNPEDFEYGGRMYAVAASRDLSPRDAKAIDNARNELLLEPALAQRVITALVAPTEKVEQAYKPFHSTGTSGQQLAATGIQAGTWVDSRAVYGSQMGQGQLSVDSGGPYQTLVIGKERIDERFVSTVKSKLGL